MKIGILTFHRANNYGAVLQCYALQKYLSKFGHDVYVIDYVNEEMQNTYKNFYIGTLNVKNLLSALYNYSLKASRNRVFEAFRRKYIRLSKEQNLSRDNLNTLGCNYDLFVVGSDQVWNPLFTDWDESFYLDFARPDQRVSYAASLGNFPDNDDTRQYYKRNIEDFRKISVRERSSVDYLGSLTGRRIDCNIDPVFLLPVKEWSEISGVRIIEKPYVFVYCLHETIAYEIANSLAEKEGLLIISIPDSKRAKVAGIKKLNATVNEFVNYIQHADYVITDSFHATAFSILFHKRFQVILKNKYTGLNPRLENLLGSLGLDNHIYHQSSEIAKDENYTAVDRKIQESIEKTRIYFSDLENSK